MAEIKERSEIPEENKWDLAPLYADSAAWEADFAAVDALMEPLEKMRGTLVLAERVAALFAGESELDRLLEKLYVFAHLRADEDLANSNNQARQARIRAKITEINGRLAWAVPEILAQPSETLRQWGETPALMPFHYPMIKLLRRKPHTLSEKEETLLSRAGEIFSGPSQTFSLLSNADMRFPKIEDEENRQQELSQARYVTFLQNPDRRVRQDAFTAMYETYEGLRNTLATTLSLSVKTHNYLATSRNYSSALGASLAADNIPVTLYDSLVGATREALPQFHEYVELRRRLLGCEDLNMADMYVPLVPECDIKVPFEQAREWVIEACRPLGEGYVAILESAFKDRWIDIYDNRGKRSGAYSSGCYDSMPYVLLNYQGTLDDVFTLAHELGHSMHSWLANSVQPPHLADYPIFIAEIASTTNEALLLHYLLQNTTEPRMRAYLLNHQCDSYKGTVYRQTMFAEFERSIHELDAGGQPLTADSLCEAYYRLNADYYGPGIEADRLIAMEWARIPHFYYNFYVYKYATSFCAAQVFAQRILEGREQRELYLDLLRAGGSNDPLLLVQAAGVDLRQRSTFEEAFAAFGNLVRELASAVQPV
jgi:oligoendopeptidase F